MEIYSKLTSDVNLELFGIISQNSVDVDYAGHHTWTCANSDLEQSGNNINFLNNDFARNNYYSTLYYTDGFYNYYVHPRMDIIRQSGIGASGVSIFSSSVTYPTVLNLNTLQDDIIAATDSLNLEMCIKYANDNISKVASSNQINQTKDTAFIEF